MKLMRLLHLFLAVVFAVPSLLFAESMREVVQKNKPSGIYWSLSGKNITGVVKSENLGDIYTGKIETLDLSNNAIVGFGPKTFTKEKFPNLTYLYLGNNRLALNQIADDAFTGMDKLWIITVGGNPTPGDKLKEKIKKQVPGAHIIPFSNKQAAIGTGVILAALALIGGGAYWAKSGPFYGPLATREAAWLKERGETRFLEQQKFEREQELGEIGRTSGPIEQKIQPDLGTKLKAGQEKRIREMRASPLERIVAESPQLGNAERILAQYYPSHEVDRILEGYRSLSTDPETPTLDGGEFPDLESLALTEVVDKKIPGTLSDESHVGWQIRALKEAKTEAMGGPISDASLEKILGDDYVREAFYLSLPEERRQKAAVQLYHYIAQHHPEKTTELNQALRNGATQPIFMEVIEYSGPENPRLDEMRALIGEGANINGRLEDHNTPLSLATINDNREGMRLLIQEGADVNVKDSPLFEVNSLEALQILLNAQQINPALPPVDVNILMRGGESLLSFTIKKEMNGEVPKLNALLAHPGVDINIRDQYSDETPLMKAAWLGNLPAVEALLANGADVTLQNPGSERALHLAYRNFGDQAARDEIKRLLIQAEEAAAAAAAH